MNKIPVYEPYLDHNEKNLVVDCMETTWISSKGVYINKFDLVRPLEFIFIKHELV